MQTTFAAMTSGYLFVFGAIAGLSLGLSGLLYLLRDRAFRRGGRQSPHMSSEIFSFFGSLYAFFLGFSLVTLWGAFGVARMSASAEAATLLNTFELASCVQGSDAFRKSLSDYVRCVVNQEWPSMDERDAMSPEAAEQLFRVWRTYQALRPAPEDSSLHAAVGQALTEVGRQRMAREQMLSGNLYPPVLVILVVGLCGVMVGLLLSNPQQTRSQVVMECVVAFLVFSCLYFIWDINTPFSGMVNVSVEPFERALTHMERGLAGGG